MLKYPTTGPGSNLFCLLEKNIVAVYVFQSSFQKFILTEMGLLNSFYPNFHLRVSSLLLGIALAACCESCDIPALGINKDRHIATPLE